MSTLRWVDVDAPLDGGEGAAVLDAYGAVFGDVGDGRRMFLARRAEPGCSFPYLVDEQGHGDEVVAFAWGASVPVGSWWPTQLAACLGPAVAAGVTGGTSVAELGVRVGHRGRGLGGVVLDALLAALTPLGGPVHLGTQVENEPARRLYESRAFATVAVYRFTGDDQQWRLMRRPPVR